MDKEKILSITKNGNVDIQVIYDYCIEKGKDVIKTSALVATLVTIPATLWMNWYRIALEYYQIKFNICLVTNKEGRIIHAFYNERINS